MIVLRLHRTTRLGVEHLDFTAEVTMLVIGPDLQREAVATSGTVAQYGLSDGRDLPLEILGQGAISRCSRDDHEEHGRLGHLDLERLPAIKSREGLCDGRHQVLREEVAHGGYETSTAGILVNRLRAVALPVPPDYLAVVEADLQAESSWLGVVLEDPLGLGLQDGLLHRSRFAKREDHLLLGFPHP